MNTKPITDRNNQPTHDNWKTPSYLYDELDREFHFNFDPCPLNADFNGLEIEWGTSNFINPPYNKIDKPRFIQKAWDEWQSGKTCVLLLPVATSTIIFHKLIYPYAEIRFLKGRVAFEGFNSNGKYVTKKKGKHDSMIVVYEH